MTLLAALIAVYLAAATVIVASRRPDYSHRRCTISELGEEGARDSRLVSLGVFLPVGAGAAILSLAAATSSLSIAALSLCLAVGYLGAAFFPCDPGAPEPQRGSRRNRIHFFAGVIEYTGGAIALLFLAALTPTFRLLALVAIIAIGTLAAPSMARWRGLSQRIAETVLFGSLIYAIVVQAH